MKKTFIKSLGLLWTLLISATLLAQTANRDISGKVTDKSNQPLPGVNVALKGTSTGTTTNDAGEYRIMVPDSKPVVLVFSFIGMNAQEITPGTSNTVDVILEAESFSLEEVVAIGYGTAKKKDLTGSVANIQGDVVAKRNVTQLSAALQGAVPGMMVTRTNSQPGAGATIRVRGITTIGDSDPLIIVDG
ncbi:MAG TPA: carboxypeptidase-like regulatory domain-containing protein, partial [Niabella sp.]|nr:carboxypeptidase-like regulatory domain-containing protein [Niabella sp.]